jgi:hypothetical protein
MTTNNRSKRFLLAAAVVAGGTLARPADATLARSATLDEKVQQAESIIVGKVVRTESKFDPTHRWILTYTTFQVEDSMKGNANGELTVVTPGGAVGHIRQETIGIPRFAPGQENVVFVKNSEAGPTVLFFDQGAYDVVTDERGEKIVQPVPSDLVKVDTQRGMAVAANESPRTLKDFRSSVRELGQRAQMQGLVKPRGGSFDLARVISENKLLIALGALGVAFATWQLLRSRS